MYIKEVNEHMILFDEASVIYYTHDQECCEHNYADFESIEPLAYRHNFKFIKFEYAVGGFRFGDNNYMVYIPCYSEQNGYYTTEISICHNGKYVLTFYAQEIFE